MFLSRSGLELNEIWARQVEALDEAVHGGIGADQHRAVTLLGWDNKYGERKYKRLGHSSELADHGHIIDSVKKRPSITFGVIHKKHDPEDDSATRLRHDDKRFVTRLTLRHHPNDEGWKGQSSDMAPRADDDTESPHTGISTREDHQRKGWAGTIWKHAKRVLKKHTKIEPTHDWDNQTSQGAAWSRAVDPDDSETGSARHEPEGDSHEEAAHKALHQHSSISDERSGKKTKWSDVHPDDQDHILDFADEHLNMNNGFWHTKHSHSALKKVMNRTGYPSPSHEFVADLFHSMGGRRK